jgi:2,5-furandicarboxylate decarboxylase 1
MPEGQNALPRGADADTERFRLRRFVEGLGGDQLETIAEPHQLGDLAGRMDGNAKAVLFASAGPERAQIVGNVLGSRTRVAAAFGVAETDILPEMLRRLATPQPLIEVPSRDAPVHQDIWTGDAADLTRLPAPFLHGRDGAPYLSATMDFTRDVVRDRTNVGFRRLMLRGRKEAGIDAITPSDLRAIYESHVAKGETMPISFALGSYPTDAVAAAMRMPIDETQLVARLRGAPLALVKSVTNDILVPADAEYVVEGYLDERGHCEAEGPFGEFLGYYGVMKRNPVFHLTAITKRRDALFQVMTIGGRSVEMTDTAILNAVRCEAIVWRALENAIREPVAVHATGASAGNFNVRIAMRQRVPGEARNAIAAGFSCLANIKHVFVVDDDIDVFDDRQVEWALATRFQAGRDLVVEDGFRAIPLDPSLDGARTGSKAGFDCTIPFGKRDALEFAIPEPPSYEGVRFESVRAALLDGPKTFEALMAAVGSRDGRDVVLALEEIRETDGLDRDAAGAWVIKPGG